MLGAASKLWGLALILGVVITAIADPVFGEELFDLAAGTKPPTMQVRTLIEVEGELKTNADGKEVQRLPVKVAAEQQYVERKLGGSAGSIRYYRESAADITLGKAEFRHALRDERRYLILDPNSPRPLLFSPLGPLSREELELVETPAALLPLTELLPETKVSIGKTWKLSDSSLVRLLCLDVLHQHDVVCRLTGVEKGIATVSLNGKAAGAIEGVSSDVELIAKYNFDLQKQVITWLALAVRENRAIGHAQPGFEAVTKIRLIAAPITVPAEVSDQSIAELPLRSTVGDTYLELRSDKGGYLLLHDRRWRVMVDRHDIAVMRLIDQGDLIAQCNVSKLPQLAAGEQLSLEEFQDDVRKTLGKTFGQIVEASQQETEGGIRVLRVVASGNASDLPIQWTYYHLSDEKGARVSLVLTLEANLVERFAGVDRELISGFRFVETTAAAPVESEEGTVKAATKATNPNASKR